jgi:hypothetical protein
MLQAAYGGACSGMLMNELPLLILHQQPRRLKGKVDDNNSACSMQKNILEDVGAPRACTMKHSKCLPACLV